MQITVENLRTILAITDENDFADEMRVYLNKTWWRKLGGKPGDIVNIVGLDHVRHLLTGLTDALEQAEKGRGLVVKELEEVERERDLVVKELERTLIAVTGEVDYPVQALGKNEYLSDAARRVARERDEAYKEIANLKVGLAETTARWADTLDEIEQLRELLSRSEVVVPKDGPDWMD